MEGHHGDLEYSVIENVKGYPLSFTSNEFRFQGGLSGNNIPEIAHQYHSDGTGALHIKTWFRHWDGSVLDGADDPDYLPGTTLYLGPIYKHFGHFMVESLARSWSALGGGFEHTNVAFFPQTSSHAERHRLKTRGLQGFQKDTLDFLDIKEPFLVTYPTVFEKLIVPQPGIILNSPTSSETFVEILTTNSIAKFGQQTTSQKVFLLRETGELLGETIFAEFFQSAGYTVVRPEALPLLEQLELIHKASHIVGVRGSAFHTLNALGRVPCKLLYFDRHSNPAGFEYNLAPFVDELWRIPSHRINDSKVALVDIDAFFAALSDFDPSLDKNDFPWKSYLASITKERS